MNKIDEYLENIKDNLCWKEIEELHDKLGVELADIKFNIKKLEPTLQEADAPDRVIAEGMIELGYPLEKVKEFLKE